MSDKDETQDKHAVLDNRIGKIERDLTWQESELKNLTSSVSQIQSENRAFFAEFRNSGKTDWKVLFTGLGLVISLGVLVLTPVMWRVMNAEENISTLAEQQTQLRIDVAVIKSRDKSTPTL